MSDMPQPAMPAGAPVHILPARPYGDDDVALGCECADPALQIERWGIDAAPEPLRADAH
jgi:hypothetical protein